uniref:Uncharacterized protein n=1 Tax=Setaria italica TaxID=4555 RepID=K3Y042_SETIT
MAKKVGNQGAMNHSTSKHGSSDAQKGPGGNKRHFPIPSRNNNSTKQGPNSKTKTALFHYISSQPLAKLPTFASARRRCRHGGGLWPDGARRLLLLLDHLLDSDHPPATEALVSPAS